MSILIKGMKMSKDGRLLISIHPDGCVYRSVYDMGFEKVDCVKAKELPPHGRLIDADALKVMMPTIGDEYLYAREMIEEAPTIIEEEAEE